MGVPAASAALRTLLMLTALVLTLHSTAGQTTTAPETTAAASATTGAATLWIMVPSRLKLSLSFDGTWMTNKNSTEYQQFVSNALADIDPVMDAELGEQHILTAVSNLDEYLSSTRIHINTTIHTTATVIGDLDLRTIETQLGDAMKSMKTINGNQVTGSLVNMDSYEVVEPFTTTTVAQTTVRERRSTTIKESTIVTSTESTSSTTGTETPSTSTTAPAASTTTAPAETSAATTTAESSTTTTTAETNTTTMAAETNTTTTAAETTTVTTTMQPTTTEAPPPVSAQLSCQVRITSLQYQDWMKLTFTSQYVDLARTVESLSEPVLIDKFGDNYRSVAVVGFRPGSVLVDMEVVVMTNKTRAEDVDAKRLSEETTIALQNLYQEGDFTFDPEAVHTKEEILVIEPTTSPAPTEDPYRHTIMRFEMRAPFANWTDELNDTDSEGFAWMENEVKAGVELMLSKKYPKGEWNVSSYILWMTNATEDADDDVTEPQGVKINFVVTVEPQMTNTSKIVKELAKSFVYFNKLGSLQIAPDSVYFKDLTTYAPGMGMVVMDEDYLRKLRRTQYNGSYIGDYTTQPPTLRPVIKRHKGFVLGIAVPAFIGMIAAIGLLLICTTIAGAKKSDD